MPVEARRPDATRMARRSWRLVPGRHTFRRCALLVIGVVVAAMVLRWMERSTPEDDTAVDDIASASLAPAEDDKVDEDRAVLFIQWYDAETAPERRSELALALAGNLANEHISAVVLVHEWLDLGDDVHRVVRRAGIDVDHTHPRLKAAYQGHPGRLQVADVVVLANEGAYAERTVILANTDILFDHTLRGRPGRSFVRRDHLLHNEHVVWALSRWEPSERMDRPSMCSPAYAGSHDSFIWRSPLPADLIDRLRVNVGAWGYENVFIHELEASGWTVGNPCLSIHTYHIHMSRIKSSGGGPAMRVNVEGRSSYARPSYHPQDARGQLVEAARAAGRGDDPAVLEAGFPWLDVVHFGLTAKILRHTLVPRSPNVPAPELCRVPPQMASLVAGFCRTYHRPGVHAWNCTHLPCGVLRPIGAFDAMSDRSLPEVDYVDCVRARSFRYRCRLFGTLAALRPGVPIVMDGRFVVNVPSFYTELERYRKPSGGPWMFHFHGESLASHPNAGVAATLARFNWTMGYDRRVYDEQSFQFLHGPMERFLVDAPSLTAAVAAWRARPRSVLFLASNCKDGSGRLAFVQALSKHIDVDAPGPCLHNIEWSDLIRGCVTAGTAQLSSDELQTVAGNRGREKAVLSQKYRFVLALENSIAYDYVTEKLWDALSAGAIPVYAGAPNIRDHLPNADAALLAHLDDPAATAAEIRRIEADDAVAERYLGWRLKSSPILDATFYTRMDSLYGPHAASRPETPCGLCERIWRTAHHINLAEVASASATRAS